MLPTLIRLYYSFHLHFIFYLDNDGDDVSFSTDDELTEALGHVSNGIFKINVASYGKHILSQLYTSTHVSILQNVLN